MLQPKEKFLDRARRNGSIDRLAKVLGAAHVINGVSNSFIIEAVEIMKDNNLLLGELKYLSNNFNRVADRFFKTYASLITKGDMSYLRDVDELERKVREWIEN